MEAGSTDEFIPLAEESGAIVPIGRWVLRNACRHGREGADRSARDLTIGVNVSTRQLRNPELIADIGDSLHLSTVAEGIETPEQLAEMRSLHYSLGQGFLFSHPIPVEDVDAMLAEGVPRPEREGREEPSG